MPSKIKVLQIIPRLGYGGAETDVNLATSYQKNGKSYIVTSGGPLFEIYSKRKS